ncbi:MAG: hypothetical protein ACXABI_04400 [Candidatus Hodarchaeales archaeon]|jgi:DNA-binding Lrp family transcriptional regulator
MKATEPPILSEIFESIRQNSEVQSDSFVLDFFNIWYEIHLLTAEASLEDALAISQSILKSHTLPFYQKYKARGNLHRYKGWIESFASFHLTWGEGGGFLFPLVLVTYEITSNKKSILFSLLTKLKTGVMGANQENLFEEIFPLFTNYVVPLIDVDIKLLKAYQILQPLKATLLKNPENKSFAELLNVSTRTIIRRLKVFQVLQLVTSTYFLDMGKLGYETFLYVHSNPFPKEFVNNLLLSGKMDIGTFSLVQLHGSNIQQQVKLQKNLDLLMTEPLSQRTISWNLSGLNSDEDLWTNPPTFFYTTPETKVSTPSPDLQMSLRPSFDLFRKLTRADFNILDFIVREGSFNSMDHLSKAVDVNRMEISNRMKEYTDENLMFRMYQFFNLGLDLSLFFFISDLDSDIPWISHLLTFPKVDVCYQTEESPKLYFGYVKLPNKWIKPFARKVDNIRENYEVKFYFKIFSTIDHFSWGIPLAKTYQAH